MSLRDEIQNDPLGRGYSGMTDVQIADSLNTEDRQRNRASMSGREVMDNVDNGEYDALTDVKKSQFLSLVSSDDLDPFGFAANVVVGIFGSGPTVSALQAARIETVSRATELGLPRVKVGHVERAR